jgi:hypothetical protein
MAVITTPNFKPLKSYVRVRLAQGVPIVDADVNEREDIGMFELRAFLKWFVGDGVPEGNDGFRVVESTASRTNNFRISSGIGAATLDALATAGRCLVNGLDVMIDADMDFRDQELFELLPSGAPKPNIVAIETRLGSPRIRAADMETGPAGTLHVWLDVWDALVTPAEDPTHMIHAGLGIDSCSREKRYWAVRVRASSTPPVAGDLEFAAQHNYYRIAEIARRGATDRNVNQADITDRREQRLLVPPSTIIPDLFNVSALDYRRGTGRPVISFRQAINAMIRGEVPATPEIALTTTNPLSRNFTSRGTFFTPGAIVSVWTSTRNGAFQIFIGSIDAANPVAGFNPTSIQALTTGLAHQFPHAVPLLNGEVLVAYEEVVSAGNEDAKLRCGSLTTGLLSQQDVAVGTGQQRRPFCVPIGGTAASEQVVVMWHDTNAANRWRYNLYQVSTHTFPNPIANDLSATAATGTPELHAAKDSAGNIWIAFVTAGDIQVVEFPVGSTPINSPPSTGPATNPTFTSAVPDKNPFVLVDRSDVPWVFWVSTAAAGASILYSRRNPATSSWSTPEAIPGLNPAINYTSNGPVAVIADDGAIWVFWDSFITTPPGNRDIWFARLDPVNGVWTGSNPTTGTARPDQDAVALSRADGVIWLFWNRLVSGTNAEVFFRRLITTL